MKLLRAIMDRISSKSSSNSDEITLSGINLDSQKTGCKNTKDSSTDSYIHFNIHLNKKNMTQESDSVFENVDEKPIIYQWLKTDLAGKYSMFACEEIEDDILYIVFKDGSRVNKELVNDYVIEVTDEDDGYIIKEEVITDITITKGKDGTEYEIPGPNHGKVKKTKIKKPRLKNVPKSVLNEARTVKKDIIPVVVQETDPLRLLLEKTKLQKNSYEITLSIDILPKELFDILGSSFDNGNETMINYMMDLIDIESFKEQLKEKLINGYGDEQSRVQ